MQIIEPMGPARMNESAAANAWGGTLTLGPGLSLFTGRAGDTSVHAHPAHKVLVGALVRATSVSEETAAPWVTAIPAALPHAVSLVGGPVLIAYLDPHRFTFDSARALAHAWRGFVPDQDDPTELLMDAQALPRRRIDRRLAVAREALEAGLRVPEAAARARLSPSRLAHLWTEQLGAPPSTFRVWWRLRDAMDALAQGDNVTRASVGAGFADAAHFARTCRRVLGIAPSALGDGRLLLARPLGECARLAF